MALISDAAKDVSGQIFGAGGDNLILYSQPRPIANLNKTEGWTPETILAEAFPQMQDKFFPLMRAPAAATRGRDGQGLGTTKTSGARFDPNRAPAAQGPARAASASPESRRVIHSDFAAAPSAS